MRAAFNWPGLGPGLPIIFAALRLEGLGPAGPADLAAALNPLAARLEGLGPAGPADLAAALNPLAATTPAPVKSAAFAVAATMG